MSQLYTYSDPTLSIWQSAAAEVHQRHVSAQTKIAAAVGLLRSELEGLRTAAKRFLTARQSGAGAACAAPLKSTESAATTAATVSLEPYPFR